MGTTIGRGTGNKPYDVYDKAETVSKAQLLTEIKKIEGSGSGLGADLWQGEQKDTLVASLRVNANISGGGVITYDSNGYFNTTKRFVVTTNGRGAFFSTNGYFDIIIPTSGTIQGVGIANVTATSAGIPVGVWNALYYILPIGSSNTSIASNFRIIHNINDLVIPDNWVLLATINSDTNTLSIAGGKYTLHKGESIDTAKYSSAFVPNADLVRGLPADFTSSKATNGYQKLPSGLIIQWGYVSGNSGSATNVQWNITFPITFPNALLHFSGSPLDVSGVGIGEIFTWALPSTSGIVCWEECTNGSTGNDLAAYWLAIGY